METPERKGQACGVNILLKPDRRITEIGLLKLPDSAVERSLLGTIVDVGWDVPEFFYVGQRVIFGKFEGTAFDLDGEGLIHLTEGDIIAELNTEDGLQPDPLDGDGWAQKFIPKPDEFLILRDEKATMSARGILLPDSYRDHSRACTAVIVSCGANVDPYKVGDAMMLAHGFGKKIQCGDQRNRVELEVWDGHRCVLYLHGDQKPRYYSKHYLQGMTPGELSAHLDPDMAILDEGDQLGLR